MLLMLQTRAFSLRLGNKYHNTLQSLITWLYKWAMKGWKLWLSSPSRTFEHFLISIIPCAIYQHFDCALRNKQTHTNTCTGYCHHLRIIEMCGLHVSSPSLLAGLIRAPLPGEHYTHRVDIWWLWSTHVRQLLDHFNHPTTSEMHRYTVLLFSFILFSQDKFKEEKIGHTNI